MDNKDMPAMPNSMGPDECRNLNIGYDRTMRGLARFNSGLSKREYIAALAMQGLLASDKDNNYCIETQVGSAIEMADALLKALEDSDG